MADEERRFYRSRDDRMISGVCAGIAEYFGVDPTWVRLLAVVLLVLGNAATLIVYIVLAIVVPERPMGEAVPSVPVPGEPVAAESASDASEVTPEPEPAAPAPAASDEPAGPAPSAHRSRLSGGVTAGLVLIAVGFIMLVAQFSPAFGWWNLWPLIIVFAGAAQALTPGHDGWGIERFFDGLVTVAVGLVFLAITMGYVGWDVWWRVLTLWPVLLIAIGLGILGGAIHQGWVKALGSVVVIAALAFAVLTSFTVAPAYLTTTGGEEFSYSEPLEGATGGTLTLKAGAGEVLLGDGDQLATAEGVTPFGAPSFEVTRQGSEAEVAFSMGDSDSIVAWPGAPGARTEMTIARDAEWDVSIEAGVSTVDADLSDIEVRGVAIKTGVSDATLKLGRVATTEDVGTVEVASGVSAVTVLVPRDVEVRVEADTGLVALEIDDSLASVGGRVWKSSEYDSDRESGVGVWDIRVASGVGSVRIRTY